ncbi:DUF1818 family protein [Leptothermofonsia sichuanensis E412]|uniref:DUF1818 family protein n=1 Tax=Leptothermofonsia sichuanensis TaxID=2917832 RepID=UPI001CA79AF2|nr:DUF1818 family protein [Leptothermofonsia sichuanensis]QZZ19398.1 DUF1818 family protein [Leptothermofonsia sichuanensis E412]
MGRILKSGHGWCIGWDTDAEVFKGLVGTDDWALELTETELNDFCRLFNQLSETMVQMSRELMDEEAIACEAESDHIWLEVEGYPHAYSLHLILLTGRGGEGRWSASAIPDLLQAIQSLKVY